jgi:sugar phosphate isomerase/epimerase
MKYAFMTFSCPQLTFGEALSVARRFGYDGIEPRIASGHPHSVELDANPATRWEIQQKAQASGVAICCIATSCTYADPTTVKQRLQETRACIDLAADVGCPRLRVFGGKMGKGLSREQAVQLVAESLQSVAEHASQRGVTICMETHDDWCDPHHVAEVMKRVNHPSIAVNWDVMHPVRQGRSTMDDAFQILRPWIRHLHVHDGSNRAGKLELKPIGQGDFDHRRVIQLLKASAYDGYISGEWIDWEPHETHLPRELATLRSYEGAAATRSC